MFHKGLLAILFLFSVIVGNAQSIQGFVLDEDANPLPYVKVWVKNYTNVGAITDEFGHYKIALESFNTYEVVYSLIGFKQQEHFIVVSGYEPTENVVYLMEDVSEFENVDIVEKSRNVGYDIVKNVMARKKELAFPIDSYTCEIYVKGRETFDFKTKEKEDVEESKETLMDDSFENETKKDKVEPLNLVETYLSVNFMAPNKLKEIKTAQSKVGYAQQVYLKESPVLIDASFNFYENLIYKNRLHETPIVSPLHFSAILSYKYKLAEIITQGMDTIYKVQIKPRSFGTSTLDGYLYIKKGEWVLTKVDLSMNKGNLKAYDNFRIVQDYKLIDGVWMVTKQTFEYDTKFGKETIRGSTEVIYSNYNLKPGLTEDDFDNEISLTIDDAYDKDSTYWNTIRPLQLNKDEQRKKFLQDSLKVAHSKKEYLDSVDAAYNKVTLYKFFIEGMGRRNREKKQQWYFPSLISLIQPINIAGPRIAPYIGYYKRFENEQRIFANLSPSIGILNGDIRGSARLSYSYNPKRLAYISANVSHNVSIIDYNVPYLGYINPANYYFSDNIGANHSFEILNGLYLYTAANLEHRSSISNLKFYNWQGDFFQTGPPIDFDPYNIFKTNIALSYTPAQKYMTEPHRKVILGSKFPTFTFRHEKGWNNILKSSVDFDKVSFSIDQKFNVRTLGTSQYKIEIGKFLNQDSVYFIDQQFFRARDVGFTSLFMSDPNNSFQNLAESYGTRDIYARLHYTHQFNGAIINLIPFMKKTRLRSVAGGGMLFVPEYNNMYYQEVFFGIQRQIKFLKERYKIGAFAIFSRSNYQAPGLQFKILFEYVNLRDVMFEY